MGLLNPERHYSYGINRPTRAQQPVWAQRNNGVGRHLMRCWLCIHRHKPVGAGRGPQALVITK